MNRCSSRAVLLLCLLALGMVGRAQEASLPSAPPSRTAPATPRPFQVGEVVLEGDRLLVNFAKGIYRVVGGVTAKAGEYVVTAREISYDGAREVVTGTGDVTLREANGAAYTGETLELDLRAHRWQFRNWTVTLPAATIGQPLIAPMFMHGDSVLGTTGRIQADNTHVSTCDNEKPHYEIICRRVEITPGEKIVARKCDLYLMGKRVLHLPVFSMALRQEQMPVMPEFGQNTSEGYYLRLRYQYAVGRTQVGTARLDLTSKLGTGLGLDHQYTLDNGSGKAFLYARQNGKEIVARLDHKQQLPLHIDMEAHADIRRNSSFTLKPTTSTNLTARFSAPTGKPVWNLNVTRRLDQSTFKSDSTSADLRYDQKALGGMLHYSGTYSSYGRAASLAEPNPAADEEFWNRATWTRPLSFGNLNLRMEQRLDVDGARYAGDNAYSPLQRLPEVMLESDAAKMHWSFLDRIPSRLTFGWGFYSEGGLAGSNPTQLHRALLNWQGAPAPVTVGKTTLTSNIGVQQTVYGDKDNTAQYTLNGNLSARTPVGPFTNSLQYGRQEARGFTPFRFDTAYPWHTVTDTLEYRTRTANASITAGRDLQFDRWQDITLSSDGRLGNKLGVRNSVAFDRQNNDWRDLVTTFTWRDTPRVSGSLGGRYDLAQSQLRQLTTELDWTVSKQWRLQWLGGYDGLNKRFLYNEYLVTRDLHCWDVSLYASEQQKTVHLAFRLKALNLQLPGFGVGSGGQSLGTPGSFGAGALSGM